MFEKSESIQVVLTPKYGCVSICFRSYIQKRARHKGIETRKRTEGFVKTRNCIFHAGRHRLSFCIPIFPVDRARIVENISDRKKKWREQKKYKFSGYRRRRGRFRHFRYEFQCIYPDIFRGKFNDFKKLASLFDWGITQLEKYSKANRRDGLMNSNAWTFQLDEQICFENTC